MFVASLDLPLTHVTEHKSRTEAEIFLSLQTADRATFMKMYPTSKPSAKFFEDKVNDEIRSTKGKISPDMQSKGSNFSVPVPTPKKSYTVPSRPRSLPAQFIKPKDHLAAQEKFLIHI